MLDKQDKYPRLAFSLFYISMFIFLLTLGLNYSIRQEVKELREWKTTYESGYCPTCGKAMDD